EVIGNNLEFLENIHKHRTKVINSFNLQKDPIPFTKQLRRLKGGVKTPLINRAWKAHFPKVN
ncbi:MAG: hypothetical protein ACJAY8_000801, partial [Sphingobacteriales bacterium]